MKSNPNYESRDHQTNVLKTRERAFLGRIGAMALAATLFATSMTVKNRSAENAPSAEPQKISSDASVSTAEPPTLVAGAEAAILSNTEELSPLVAGVETVFASPLEKTEPEVNNNPKTESALETEETVSSSGISKNELLSKTSWDGPVLNAEMGLNHGPTGEETFYNLPMDEIVARMHRRGVEGEYWVREDGVKMLGDYVMVAADLKLHPRGSTVETSLGTGMVCDTGDFTKEHPERLDIATNWEDPRKNKVVE
ncbi:hypothetical protein IJG27_02590 [Candidatus Saccharibacteria bacterium]|nr:hypothetical protein [Candidatus Saccharibacteria bacterium]